nr:hypothetical protein Iba_chr14eCG4310 [Ipomoea batatas]
MTPKQVYPTFQIWRRPNVKLQLCSYVRVNPLQRPREVVVPLEAFVEDEAGPSGVQHGQCAAEAVAGDGQAEGFAFGSVEIHQFIDEPDPVGIFAPRADQARARALHPFRHVIYVRRHGVDVADNLVPTPRKPQLVEQLMAAVQTASVILGVRVRIECVVGCLREFAVFDNLSSQPRVERIEKPFPLATALEFSPFQGYVFLRGHGGSVAHITEKTGHGFCEFRGTGRSLAREAPNRVVSIGIDSRREPLRGCGVGDPPPERGCCRAVVA